MANRTNRKMLDTLVGYVNETYNRPEAARAGGKSCVGHILLDHNVAYGGYSLSEIDNESGAERRLADSRKTAREMESFLSGLLVARSL